MATILREIREFGGGRSATLEIAQTQASQYQPIECRETIRIVLEAIEQASNDPLSDHFEQILYRREEQQGYSNYKITFSSGATIITNIDGSIMLEPVNNDPNRSLAFNIRDDIYILGMLAGMTGAFWSVVVTHAFQDFRKISQHDYFEKYSFQRFLLYRFLFLFGTIEFICFVGLATK